MHTHIKPFGKFSYSGEIKVYNYGEPKSFLYVGNFTSIGTRLKVFLDHGHHYSDHCTTYPFWKNLSIGVDYESKTNGKI